MNINLDTPKLWKRIILGFGSVLVLVIISFFIWAQFIYTADQTKLEQFFAEHQDSISVNEYPTYFEILPKDNQCTAKECVPTGFIFYPGAKVDPQAYFYKLAFLVTENNTTLFITKPPLHLAFFGINQADVIIENNPNIKNWTNGGHSLGGAMACVYTQSNPDKITALVLLGSYCANNLSALDLKVISIHGSLDGLLDTDKIETTRKNLPVNNIDFVITGMNHAQAGNYGAQSGDNVPTKSDQDVQAEITSIITAALLNE